MKIISLFIPLFVLSCSFRPNNTTNLNNTHANLDMMNSTNIYDYAIANIAGTDSIRLSDFKGKKILFVNVASECGYTSQYAALQELYDTFKDKLVIIGLPCNQFGGQEPGKAEEIQTFCQKNYGVTFLLTEKIDVKGDKQTPIYAWLTQKALNGKDDFTVKWNFNKFLVSEKGELMAYFPSGTKPISEEIISLIN